ncbi:MAG: uracil-DNA glycosylase family protein [Pirellulaceae bacterium]|nr:uracil-DNA glycosylase family protein [Pirellulaceae bacterium]
MDRSNPVPVQISASEAAQGAQQWLRMLAQAGATMLPHLDQSVSNSPSEHWSDPWSDLWRQVIVVPEPSHSAPSVTAQPPAIPSSASPTRQQEIQPPTRSSPAGSSSAHSAPKNPPTASVAPVETTARPPLAEPSRTTPSPNLKSVIQQVEKAALTTYRDWDDPTRVIQLRQLEEQVTACTLCSDLVKFRTQPVFGVGNVRPRLVMIGEAPGVDEDRMGEPFVGASGQLLDKIIAAMKLRRQDVYILNTVKCRPPQNRNPTDTECLNCRPYWEGQLELLQPEVIVCLGAVASKTLLQTTQPVGQLRGAIHEYRGVKVVVTYHPSYLLRTESAKRQTWDDMKVVMNVLGQAP